MRAEPRERESLGDGWRLACSLFSARSLYPSSGISWSPARNFSKLFATGNVLYPSLRTHSPLYPNRTLAQPSCRSLPIRIDYLPDRDQWLYETRRQRIPLRGLCLFLLQIAVRSLFADTIENVTQRFASIWYCAAIRRGNTTVDRSKKLPVIVREYDAESLFDGGNSLSRNRAEIPTECWHVG